MPTSLLRTGSISLRVATSPPRRKATASIQTRKRHLMSEVNGKVGDGPRLRILMLHGFTQTGHLFEMKTKALKKALEKNFPPAPKPGHLSAYPGGVELVYPTAPIKLDVHDIPGFNSNGENEPAEAFGWWRRKDDGERYVYAGLDVGLARIAETLETAGPFAGVLGFSQGGAAAGIVASLLEPERPAAFEAAGRSGGIAYPDSFTKHSGLAEEMVHPALKFAVSYSGFAPSANPLYQAFYRPRIKTPMLHFLGSMDTIVSEERSLVLVDSCENGRGTEGGVPRVVYHPGGHFLPSSQKQYVAALVAFIREAIGEETAGSGSGSGEQEGRVEDMEVPF